MKIIRNISLFIIILSKIVWAQDEELRLITYYPYPYGSYQNLFIGTEINTYDEPGGCMYIGGTPAANTNASLYIVNGDNTTVSRPNWIGLYSKTQRAPGDSDTTLKWAGYIYSGTTDSSNGLYVYSEKGSPLKLEGGNNNKGVYVQRNLYIGYPHSDFSSITPSRTNLIYTRIDDNRNNTKQHGMVGISESSVDHDINRYGGYFYGLVYGNGIIVEVEDTANHAAVFNGPSGIFVTNNQANGGTRLSAVSTAANNISNVYIGSTDTNYPANGKLKIYNDKLLLGRFLNNTEYGLFPDGSPEPRFDNFKIIVKGKTTGVALSNMPDTDDVESYIVSSKVGLMGIRSGDASTLSNIDLSTLPNCAVYGRGENGIVVLGQDSSSQGVIYAENTSTGTLTDTDENNDAIALKGVCNVADGYGVYGRIVDSYYSKSHPAGYFEGKILTTDSGGTRHVYDIGELVKVKSDVGAGDVVIIAHEEGRIFEKCFKKADKMVAGVISKDPQFSLGDKEEANKQNLDKDFKFEYIAIAGQVRCKVDATSFEILPGDLLITSPNPGYAMKAEPVIERSGIALYPSGYILGKALEPLIKGEKGEILVDLK